MLVVALAVFATVAAALIARSDVAPGLLALGIRAPLVHPALALLPACLALLITRRRESQSGESRRGEGGRWLNDPVLGSGAALVAGYALALTVSLPLSFHSDDETVTTVLAAVNEVLGLAAGLAFMVVGVRRAIRARGGGSGRRATILAGAGFALSSLSFTDADEHVPKNVMDSSFRYFEVIDSIGLYLAFLIGFGLTVAVAVLAVALARTTRGVAAAAGSQGGAVAGGVLLALGGAFVAYVSALGLLALNDENVFYSGLGRFSGIETYGWFADYLAATAVPWLVGALAVALLTTVVLGGVRERRRETPHQARLRR